MTQRSLKVIDASWDLIAMGNPSFYLMSLCFWIMLNLSLFLLWMGFSNLGGNWALVCSCSHLLQYHVSAARGQCSHRSLQESAEEEPDWTPWTSQVRAPLMDQKRLKHLASVYFHFKMHISTPSLGSSGNTSWSMWRRGLLERSLSPNLQHHTFWAREPGWYWMP